MKKIIGKYIGWATDCNPMLGTKYTPMIYQNVDLRNLPVNKSEIIKTDFLIAIGCSPAFTYKPSPEGTEDEYQIIKVSMPNGKALYFGADEVRMNEYLYFDFTEYADLIEKHRISKA